MKPLRVTVSLAVLGSLLLAAFLVPLPIGRVRQVVRFNTDWALVQVEPDANAAVYVIVPGILEKLHVKNGQTVEKGDVLAEFRNLELETQLEDARTQYDINNERMRSLIRQAGESNLDRTERSRLESQVAEARGERDRYERMIFNYEKNLEELRLVAPRSGVVMSPPRVDEIGMNWDKEMQKPFCTIGDPSQLRVLMAMSPSEYRLLQEDLESARKKGDDLEVILRVQGRAEKTWKDRIEQMPESEAKEIPVQLTNKGGGNIAVQPTAKPGNSMPPQSQQYLVAVAFLDPDNSICPGTLAQVNVHHQWRTCAWWAWRAFSSAFDLGKEPMDFLPDFMRPS
jgi:multidrug efflux pump subunit AcrA (membrane-fusion protein)